MKSLKKLSSVTAVTGPAGRAVGCSEQPGERQLVLGAAASGPWPPSCSPTLLFHLQKPCSLHVRGCVSVLLLSQPLLAQLCAPWAPSLALIPYQRVQSSGSSTPGVALPPKTDPSPTQAVSWHSVLFCTRALLQHLRSRGAAQHPHGTVSSCSWLLPAVGPEMCLQRWARGLVSSPPSSYFPEYFMGNFL